MYDEPKVGSVVVFVVNRGGVAHGMPRPALVQAVYGDSVDLVWFAKAHDLDQYGQTPVAQTEECVPFGYGPGNWRYPEG